jgi:hypothetical protein
VCVQFGSNSMNYALRAARRRQHAESTVDTWTGSAESTEGMVEVCLE